LLIVHKNASVVQKLNFFVDKFKIILYKIILIGFTSNGQFREEVNKQMAVKKKAAKKKAAKKKK
jgi:hypothetical protein